MWPALFYISPPYFESSYQIFNESSGRQQADQRSLNNGDRNEEEHEVRHTWGKDLTWSNE